jgi:hypothetical protein
MAGESEGRAGKVIVNVMAPNQRRATLQQQMNMAVQLHRTDNVSTGSEVHGASTLLHAGCNGARNGASVQGHAIPFRSETANVTDGERLGKNGTRQQEKKKRQGRFSQRNTSQEIRELFESHHRSYRHPQAMS